MAKPKIKNITPFDALSTHEIEFSWNGDMAYKNRLIIYDAESLEVVYDKTITSFNLKHSLPANTLQNGSRYLAQAQIFNKYDEPSALSDKLLFYVLKTPTFFFKDISNGQAIDSSSLAVTVEYEQENNELIGNHKFYLYDRLKQELLESESFSANDMSYTYRGLENTTLYYIRCIGTTQSGMPIDTGYVQISVKFANPSKYSKIYATNFPRSGYIRYETNVKIIQYNGSEIYEFEDSFIDLINKHIEYDDGFIIPKDFTLKIKGKNLYRTATVFTAGRNYKFTLSSRIYDEGKVRFKLEAFNGLSSYVLYSNSLVFDETSLLTIWLRRINNIYDLKVFVDENYSEQKDTWFGSVKPITPNRYDYWVDTENIDTQLIESKDMQVILDKEPKNPLLFTIWLGGD